ncbi:MAG: FtsH protease activity modulator HflK [Spirochaetales bacterium]|uniref:Protein HflK n=1 Tax=Candidatus Thalassospirochaeta sargassi TaxID=3119039 RepID=A0AAJ1IGM0_9SPIO|nr:FtsH protease activity modulator HflK [Spirochaetales bacterium]
MSERNAGPGRPNIRIRPRLIAIILIVVIALAAVLSSFYMVDQTEQSVILLFGKYNRITGPGLHTKLPFGIEKNYNVPTQVIQTMPFGFRTQQAGLSTIYDTSDYPEESVMLTGDLNIVDVEWVIQYRIVDPFKWLFKVENQAKTIRDISQSVINMLVGDRAILNVMGSERTTISLQSQELMNQIFDNYDLGITVTTVQLKNIVPPIGEVQDAYEDVNMAIQDMEKLINEGKESYNNEIPLAQGTAAQMIQVAEGYATERVNEAKGNVARFNSVLEEYQKNKEVTRSRLYIEMIEDVFSQQEGTDVIDKNLDNFLPLKSLQGGVQ